MLPDWGNRKDFCFAPTLDHPVRILFLTKIVASIDNPLKNLCFEFFFEEDGAVLNALRFFFLKSRYVKNYLFFSQGFLILLFSLGSSLFGFFIFFLFFFLFLNLFLKNKKKKIKKKKKRNRTGSRNR
jgi:predicted membrane protein